MKVKHAVLTIFMTIYVGFPAWAGIIMPMRSRLGVLVRGGP